MDGLPSRGKPGVYRAGVAVDGKGVCFKYQIFLRSDVVVLVYMVSPVVPVLGSWIMRAGYTN